MKFVFYGFIGFAVFSIISCTEKKPIPKEVTDLDEKITKMEAELAATDTNLKKALDHGLQIKMTSDRELLNSRLQREKERMKMIWPNWEKERLEKAGAGGGGEGGGGGHH